MQRNVASARWLAGQIASDGQNRIGAESALSQACHEQHESSQVSGSREVTDNLRQGIFCKQQEGNSRGHGRQQQQHALSQAEVSLGEHEKQQKRNRRGGL